MKNKKNILIYAHYYAPDVASTGQILKELAEGLLRQFNVTVICTVPSYSGKIDKEYKVRKYYKETINGVTVIRVRVPEFSKQNKFSRIINIISYYKSAKSVTNMLGSFDYVFAISQPPILGGMLGVYGKKKKNARFIYNIQDFNPEQVMAVKYSKLRVLLNVMLSFDKKSCMLSDKIIVVGRDQIDTIKHRFGTYYPPTALINNWIDEKKVYPLPSNDAEVCEFRKKYDINNKFVVMYSGNLGLYYDLLNILKTIKRFQKDTITSSGRKVAFVFVGAGSCLTEMKEYVTDNGMENVTFIPYQNKDNIIYSLNAADVHWCVNSKGIKGISCPSKFYGIAACAKPVIGVLEKDTEIRCLIEESKCGLCSDPECYDDIYKNLSWFISHDNEVLNEMGLRGRNYLECNLTKEKSINKYIDEILSI